MTVRPANISTKNSSSLVSKHFHNSQNENDNNYRNPRSMKFSVSRDMLYLCWFLVKYAKKSGQVFEIFGNKYNRIQHYQD